MASGVLSSIQFLSTKLLESIRGTTSHQQDNPASPDAANQNECVSVSVRVREDLEKLSRMLVRIQAVQQDAEEREIHDRSVRLWLAELRGVAYQAEDVLDEFHYEVLRSVVEGGDSAIESYHREKDKNTIVEVTIDWTAGDLNTIVEVTFEHCPKLRSLTIPAHIVKLKIHECGFHEIMFLIKSKNMHISNCPELISINWKDVCFYSVREVTFEYCSKLRLVTVPSVIRKLKIHECGFREIILETMPENISISSCLDLNSIECRNVGSNSIREGSFEYCPKLEFAPIPFGILKLKIHECGFREIIFPSLPENLILSNCPELISINWRDDSLNNISEVTFEYCPKLEQLTIPAGILKLNIHQCGFREIVLQSKMVKPVVENLRISSCQGLINIDWSKGGSIGEFSLEYCPQLIFPTLPSEIKYLKINKCGFQEIVLPSKSEKLSISNCPELISINWMEGDLNSNQEVTVEYCPKLTLPTIPIGMKKLKISYCGIQKISFPNQSGIKMVDISHCPVLASIHLVERDTLKHSLEIHKGLKSLRVFDCPFLHQLPMKAVLMTERVEIYDCPRMDWTKRNVYQRNITIKELNLFGNEEILLSPASVNSTSIALLNYPFRLFFSKEDSLPGESFTCAPSVGVNCQSIMLNLAMLVILEISRCSKVISVTGLDNLNNLKRLSISYCAELCDWKDKRVPLSLKYLELEYCDKLSSLPSLSVENQPSFLKMLVIRNCPLLTILEGFNGMMNLKTTEILHCRNLFISPGTESQFRPHHITISGCPLLKNWFQGNSITYCEAEVNLTDYPQGDSEAEQESAGSTTNN